MKKLTIVAPRPTVLATADGALLLSLRVRPGARRSAWRGRVGECLKLDVAAAPEGGRANAAMLAFIAQSLGVARSEVRLCAGATGRQKQVRVTGPWRLPADFPA